MRVLTLTLAFLFLIPFLLTLSWWSDYHFGMVGTLPATAFGMFLILGVPTGITSALMFWLWARSKPPGGSAPQR